MLSFYNSHIKAYSEDPFFPLLYFSYVPYSPIFLLSVILEVEHDDLEVKFWRSLPSFTMPSGFNGVGLEDNGRSERKGMPETYSNLCEKNSTFYIV